MAKLMRTFPELMLIVKARTKVGIIGQLVVQGCVGQCIGVMGFIYIYICFMVLSPIGLLPRVLYFLNGP